MEIPAAISHKNILVVDDESTSRDMIKFFLKDSGFENTYDAFDGESAYEMILTRTIDLIICDWEMPKLDGFGLLTKLNEHLDTASIPFIMLTGTSDSEHVKAAIAAGASDYIVKPYQPDALLTKVSKLLLL
jgi:two-component system chemotaxis response regulator CheY